MIHRFHGWFLYGHKVISGLAPVHMNRWVDVSNSLRPQKVARGQLRTPPTAVSMSQFHGQIFQAMCQTNKV